MAKLDRLSSLLNNFRLQATAVSLCEANLAALRSPKTGQAYLIFTPRHAGIDPEDCEMLFSLAIDFGSQFNPLSAALPGKAAEVISDDGDLSSIVSLLASEQEANRCGCPAVLSRLGEVLVVRMLRLQLNRGVTTPGLSGRALRSAYQRGDRGHARETRAFLAKRRSRRACQPVQQPVQRAVLPVGRRNPGRLSAPGGG